MIDPALYNITIRKMEFEGESYFEARVAELPDVAEFADTFEEAYELATDTIATTSEVFAEKNRAMPEPHIPVSDFSGRVTLRIPKTLHKRAAEIAEAEATSLNTLMVTALSHWVGARKERDPFLSAWASNDEVAVMVAPSKRRQKRVRTSASTFDVETSAF